MFLGVSTLSSAMARDENVLCNNLIDCNEFVDDQSLLINSIITPFKSGTLCAWDFLSLTLVKFWSVSGGGA